MVLQLLTQFNSPNYTPASQVTRVYGRPRVVKGITIHWWGAGSPQFQNVINFLCDGNRPNRTSAHYVVEAGRAACIVDPDDAAWHSGSSVGNAETVGLELNPRASDGDYEAAAEIVRDLRAVYGALPLYPHKHWKNTACPGVYDLGRINQLAVSSAPPSAPIPPVIEVPIQHEDEDETMYYEVITEGSNHLAKQGWWYKQVGNGPITAMTNLEVEGFIRPKVNSGVIESFAKSHGNDLELLMAVYGVAEYKPLPANAPFTSLNGGTLRLAGPGPFTGRLKFPGDPELGDWHYPKTQSVA